MGKNVKIKCKSAGELSLDLLEVIQGDLKELSSENLKKLKKSIVSKGFSFPIFVWENPEDAKICVLDGTQRIRALKSLKEDGYKIPQIPVAFIEADSLSEAKEKLLLATSNYGKFTKDGVFNFTLDLDLTHLQNIEIPHLDFSSIEKTDVSAHERVINSEVEDKTMDVDFSERCPHCGEAI